MGKMNAGKIMEVTASQAAWAAGGTSRMAKAMGDFCRNFGVPFRPTDEESADRRRSALYMAGNRLNNGRGEVFADAILRGPVLGVPGLFQDIPVSFKGGDSRDISTDIPFIRSAVEAGMPLWCILLDGEAEAVEYTDGVRVDVPPARNLTMRRINVTHLLRDCIQDWTQAMVSNNPAFIRENKVGKYSYLRVRVSWKRVPEEYFLDPEPVAWNPSAPLPSPPL